ncbi:hypothetical protein CK203_065968 [Vitis vinifera]|uniref:Uncharacterized protein n=1 Tax=Vitis vinifera TaxID=29760 RepID=A0A438G3I8_VITVI|nr:hypothetical protein CK203_065968 [Vitis vinifera]
MECHLVLLNEGIRPGDHPLHQGQVLHAPRSQLVALLQRKPEFQRDFQTLVGAQRFIPPTAESMTTHRVRDPTVIHFTIDGRHGILRARHIAEALHIPYEHVSPADYREWTHLSQSDMRRGAILKALFRISKGFYFGPHNLTMTALFYFEEKVHRKKL